MPNRFIPLHAGTDMNQVLAILNKNFGELDNESVTKIFNVTNNSPGFIQGKLPNNLGYGFLLYAADGKVAIACYINSNGRPILKIAKDGFDALTATNDQLIFNSDQNVFKIVSTGIVQLITSTGGPSAVTVNHGLGYVPAPLVYMEFPGSATSRTPLPYIETGPSGIEVVYSIDANNLVVECRVADPFGPNTYGIRYYLMQETAN